VPRPERLESWIVQWHFTLCHYYTVTAPGLCTAFQLTIWVCTAMKLQHTKKAFFMKMKLQDMKTKK